MKCSMILLATIFLLTTCRPGEAVILGSTPRPTNPVQPMPTALLAETITPLPASTTLATPSPSSWISTGSPGSIPLAEVGSLIRQANGIFVEKNIAYVTSWEGLHLLDISDPVAPRQVGLYPTPEQSAAGVTVAGQMAYIMAIGLHLVDVSEPTSPRRVGFYQPPPAPISTPAVAGDIVYLAAGETGLIIVDVSDPAVPHELTRIPAENASRVVVVEMRAYVLDRGGVRILDISNPVTPHQLGLYRVADAQDIIIMPSATDRAVTLAYVLTGNILYLVDMSDPTRPRELGSYAPAGTTFSLAVNQNTAYIATSGSFDGYGGLDIVDMSNPAAPRPLGFIAATAEEPWYSGGMVAIYQTAARVDIYAVSRFGGSLFGFPDIQNLIRRSLSGVPTPSLPAASIESPVTPAGMAQSIPMTTPLSITSPLTQIPAANPGSTSVSPDFELVGGLGGMITAVSIQGEYAYIGEGLKLVVLDISDPARCCARPVGSLLLPQSPVDIEIASDYAYVAQAEGLYLINLANPTVPAMAGVYTAPGSATGVTVDLNRPYVYLTYDQGYDPQNIYQGGGLAVLDISNPARPVEVSLYQTPNRPFDMALVFQEDRFYAYLAEETACSISPSSRGFICRGQVRILDLTEPGQPVEQAVYVLPQTARQVITHDDRAYVAQSHCNDEIGCEGGIALLDISDPIKPRQLGFYDKPTERMAIAGNYLYTGDPLYILDISDPANLQEIAVTTLAGRVEAVAGHDIYLIDWRGKMQIIDSSNPANPLPTGLYEAPGPHGGWDIKVKGNYAYVADPIRGGLVLVDISELSQPKQAGFLAIDPSNRIWEVNPPYVYVGDEWLGVNIIDVSNPLAPALAGFYRLPDGQRLRAVAGGYAYLATFSGFQIVDLSSPKTPREIGFYELSSNLGILDLAAGGGFVYFAAYEDGWQMVDWTEPEAPVDRGFSPLPLDFQSMIMAGSYAYYSAAGQGMQILDLSNPAAPVKLGFYQAPGLQKVAAVRNEYAFVIIDLKLHLVDISNPAAPVEVGRYEGLKPVEAVALASDPAAQAYAYIYSPAGRFQVLDLSNPAAPVVLGNVTLSSEDWLPATDMIVAGRYAYLYDRTGGSATVIMIDISNPAAPVEAGTYQASGMVRAIQAKPGTVSAQIYGYIVDFEGNLHIVDLSNPVAPAEVSLYDIPETILGVTVHGQKLYLSLERGLNVQTLRWLDISDPAAPVEVGSYEVSANLGGSLAAGNYTYTPARQWVLRIVDVSDPAQPVNVGVSRLPPGNVEQVLVGEGLVFTILQPQDQQSLETIWALHVVDISTPTAPQSIGTFKPQDPALYQLQVATGGYLYFLDRNSRLRRIDILNPAALQESLVSSYIPAGFIRSLTVAGDEVYLSMDQLGMAILRLRP